MPKLWTQSLLTVQVGGTPLGLGPAGLGCEEIVGFRVEGLRE